MPSLLPPGNARWSEGKWAICFPVFRCEQPSVFFSFMHAIRAQRWVAQTDSLLHIDYTLFDIFVKYTRFTLLPDSEFLVTLAVACQGPDSCGDRLEASRQYLAPNFTTDNSPRIGTYDAVIRFGGCRQSRFWSLRWRRQRSSAQSQWPSRGYTFLARSRDR